MQDEASFKELVTASKRWLEVDTSFYRVEDFLEDRELYRSAGLSSTGTAEVSSITRRRLDQLLGPYYKTIIKAWLVTHGR